VSAPIFRTAPRRRVAAACAALVALAGCGTASPKGGAHAQLERACRHAAEYDHRIALGLKAAEEAKLSGNASVPRAIVEKIGEPAGESASAWTGASEAARMLGKEDLARLAGRVAEDYGEVQFDLSPEGGGYETTRRLLIQGSVAAQEFAAAAKAAGFAACAEAGAG